MINRILSSLSQYYVGYKINRLKKQADKLAKQLNTEVFIVKYKGSIKCVTAKWFKYQRQHGVFSKKFTIDKFRATAYYSTKG